MGSGITDSSAPRISEVTSSAVFICCCSKPGSPAESLSDIQRVKVFFRSPQGGVTICSMQPVWLQCEYLESISVTCCRALLREFANKLKTFGKHWFKTEVHFQETWYIYEVQRGELTSCLGRVLGESFKITSCKDWVYENDWWNVEGAFLISEIIQLSDAIPNSAYLRVWGT